MRELGAVCLDGDIIDVRDVRLEPFSRAFRWGEGLFETIRVRGGVLEYLADHLRRMSASARALGFQPPDVERIARMACLFVKARSLERGAVRITLARRDARRLWPCDDPATSVLITGSEGIPYPEDIAARGLAAAVIEEPCRVAGFLSRHKTTSYLASIMARKAAFEASADIAVMRNQFGRIAEADIANIFVRCADGRVVTPPIEEGALPGITRARLMAAMPGIEEAPLTKEDLRLAEELVFTNALMPVIPASRLDGRPLVRRDLFIEAREALERGGGDGGEDRGSS
jgi:branched-chain amino acid aminotransferase